MTTDIRCSVCGGHFSSTDSYQNHLPCHKDPSIIGARGDDLQRERFGSQETVKGGDGSN